MTKIPKPDQQSPYFKMYPRDFFASTNVAKMDVDEQGTYALLLFREWLDGYIPSDVEDLAAILKVPLKVFEKRWKRVSRCFLPVEGEPDKLINARLENERRHMIEIQEDISKKRSAAATIRWSREKPKRDKSSSGKPTKSNAIAYQGQSISNAKSDINETKSNAIAYQEQSISNAKSCYPDPYPYPYTVANATDNESKDSLDASASEDAPWHINPEVEVMSRNGASKGQHPEPDPSTPGSTPGKGKRAKSERPARSERDLAADKIDGALADLIVPLSDKTITKQTWRTQNHRAALELHDLGHTPEQIAEYWHRLRHRDGGPYVRLDWLQQAMVAEKARQNIRVASPSGIYVSPDIDGRGFLHGKPVVCKDRKKPSGWSQTTPDHLELEEGKAWLHDGIMPAMYRDEIPA